MRFSEKQLPTYKKAENKKILAFFEGKFSLDVTGRASDKKGLLSSAGWGPQAGYPAGCCGGKTTAGYQESNRRVKLISAPATAIRSGFSVTNAAPRVQKTGFFGVSTLTLCSLDDWTPS